MMIISEYLDTIEYFNDFNEIKKYFGYEDVYDLEDLEEKLKEEYNGMEYPKLKILQQYEVETWWDGYSWGTYYDTLESAIDNFKKIVCEMKEIHEEFKETEDKKKFINEYLEWDNLYNFIQINKFNEFEEVEVLTGKEFNWDRF